MFLLCIPFGLLAIAENAIDAAIEDFWCDYLSAIKSGWRDYFANSRAMLGITDDGALR